MALASAFRRMNGSSAPPLNLRSQFSWIRLCSALPPVTSPRLFVSGLSEDTNDQSLHKAFQKFGTLLDARVIKDRESGDSRRFGFVTFATVADAQQARDGMNLRFIDGWVVFVDPAEPRKSTQQRPPR